MAQGDLSAETGFSGPAFSPDPLKKKKSGLLPKRIVTECGGEDNRRLGKSYWLCWGKAGGKGHPSISQRQTAKEASLDRTQD